MYTAVNNYLENKVLNASPEELIIMLYDKAISSLKKVKPLLGKDSLEPEDIKIKAEYFSKTVDIITYLKACLNHQKGKEIAKNLDEIYQILIDELLKAQITNDIKKVEDAIEILSNLKNAWEEVRKTLKAKQTNVP